jgi:hypothetical protein
VSPEKRRNRASAIRSTVAKVRPTPADEYHVVYFQRHKDDDPDETSPGRTFLANCPPKVRVTMRAVLAQVAAAPPHRFAGGGKWEAMHGELAGFHEVRVDGPRRHHYRLFCRLDTEALDAAGNPAGSFLTVIDGADKPFRTTFPAAVYRRVRALGEEYLSRNPRSFAR